MMPSIDVLDALFKTVNLHFVANSHIINKVAKLWCLVVPNLVQNSSVNSRFIFINYLLNDKFFSFAKVYEANTC